MALVPGYTHAQVWLSFLVKCRALSTCDSGLPDSVSKIEHLRCEHRHSAAKGMRAVVLPVVVLILYIYLTCWVAPVLARASRCSEVPHLILAVQGRRNDIAAHLFVRSSVGLVFTGSTCRMVSAIHAGHRDLASSPHSHRTLPPHHPTAPLHHTNSRPCRFFTALQHRALQRCLLPRNAGHCYNTTILEVYTLQHCTCPLTTQIAKEGAI